VLDYNIARKKEEGKNRDRTINIKHTLWLLTTAQGRAGVDGLGEDE
jgi:hypothetical protein